MISSDINSANNPALCSLILRSFLTGFEEVKKDGCEFPILFLTLPFILSGNIRERFKGSNINTGLLTWLSREPQVLINLPKRIEVANLLTKKAIIFGTTNNVIKITDNGLFMSDSSGIVKSKLDLIITEDNQSDIYEMFTLSKRFGGWCGQLESTIILYNIMGLTL